MMYKYMLVILNNLFIEFLGRRKKSDEANTPPTGMNDNKWIKGVQLINWNRN